MEIGRIMNTNAHIHVGITIKTIQKFTKEVHKSDARFKIACKWIEFISSGACARGDKKIFFNILV